MSDANALREWESKIKKVFTTYLGLEYGFEVPEHTEKEIVMTKYYLDKVKNLKPKLSKNESGQIVVSGLNSLRE